MKQHLHNVHRFAHPPKKTFSARCMSHENTYALALASKASANVTMLQPVEHEGVSAAAAVHSLEDAGPCS